MMITQVNVLLGNPVGDSILSPPQPYAYLDKGRFE